MRSSVGPTAVELANWSVEHEVTYTPPVGRHQPFQSQYELMVECEHEKVSSLSDDKTSNLTELPHRCSAAERFPAGLRCPSALVSNPVMIAYKLEVVDGDTVKKALRFQKLVSAPRM